VLLWIFGFWVATFFAVADLLIALGIARKAGTPHSRPFSSFRSASRVTLLLNRFGAAVTPPA
jgi:hypothetical protein